MQKPEVAWTHAMEINTPLVMLESHFGTGARQLVTFGAENYFGINTSFIMLESQFGVGAQALGT